MDRFSSDTIFFFCFTWTSPPLNLCHFQSQHNTKCWADSLPLWVALFPIFSPPRPLHHLGEEEEAFVQKTKKKPNRHAKGTNIVKGTFAGIKTPRGDVGLNKHASPTSFVVVKCSWLFSFLSFSLGERGSALRALHRNHRAHNNRRKPVTWVSPCGHSKRREGREVEWEAVGYRAFLHLLLLSTQAAELQKNNQIWQISHFDCCLTSLRCAPLEMC